MVKLVKHGESRRRARTERIRTVESQIGNMQAIGESITKRIDFFWDNALTGLPAVAGSGSAAVLWLPSPRAKSRRTFASGSGGGAESREKENEKD